MRKGRRCCSKPCIWWKNIFLYGFENWKVWGFCYGFCQLVCRPMQVSSENQESLLLPFTGWGYTVSSIETEHRSGLQFMLLDDARVAHWSQHQKQCIRSEPRILISSTTCVIFSLLCLSILLRSLALMGRGGGILFQRIFAASMSSCSPSFNLTPSLACVLSLFTLPGLAGRFYQLIAVLKLMLHTSPSGSLVCIWVYHS